MAIVPPSDPAVVLDANVVIALCAREADKHAIAEAALRQYALDGWLFYAPNVLVAECQYVLCGKLRNGALRADEHRNAVLALDAQLKTILPPPDGENSLIFRAEQIRNGYGCSHSADGLYIALAETLAQTGETTLLTFDAGMQKQVTVVLPSLPVHHLAP